MTSHFLSPDPSAADSSGSFNTWRRFRRQHPRLLVILGATGVLLLAGISIATWRLTNQAPQTVESRASQILPVETLTVQPVDSYQVSRTYTGEIAALRASDLGFERSGELVQVLVKEGDRVATGQPLARLDTRNLQTQRQQLNAEKARAQAQLVELKAGPRPEDINAARAAVRDLEEQLKLQQVQRQRREFLYREGAISKEELDEYTYGAQALEARLEQARSNLEELLNGTRWEQIAAQQAAVHQLDARIADLDITIAKSTLKAPFAGIVATRHVDEGTVVRAGQSVINLVENAAPEARIGMPKGMANSLPIGSSQTVQIGSERYTATVSSILPKVNPDTRTQVVVLDLERSAISQINPGQTVRVDLIETIPTQGYWLPTEALSQGIRGLWICYVLTQSENTEPGLYEIQQQSVEILHQQSDRVLVRGTLQAGDRIVANGTHRLVPGQKVRPIGVIQG
ncbi:MAG: efflux RND transporter periplasmic adaptor subunit [Coleofasciculus sp. B1-GNL1-01]|uniref:efflux RND transporter periplasmic adaptor subunit n=1 Tax=Coleofasciculus sp. B1-GNL1-01 TaxID=3068484 RepID=UPI0032F9C6DF